MDGSQRLAVLPFPVRQPRVAFGDGLRRRVTRVSERGQRRLQTPLKRGDGASRIIPCDLERRLVVGAEPAHLACVSLLQGAAALVCLRRRSAELRTTGGEVCVMLAAQRGGL